MRKKVMMAAIAAVVSVGAYAGFNSYRANSGSSSLLLDNAEALSDDEQSPIDTKKCYGGRKECARVAIKPTEVHIYYEPE